MGLVFEFKMKGEVVRICKLDEWLKFRIFVKVVISDVPGSGDDLTEADGL